MSPRNGSLGWGGVLILAILIAILQTVGDEPWFTWWMGILMWVLIWMVPIEMLRIDAIKQYKVQEVEKWGRR
jgi:hypothetical protein